MKRRMLTLLLAGVLASSLMLGGCSKKKAEPATKDVSTVDTKPQGPEYLAPDVTIPDGAESMVNVIDSLLEAMYDTEGVYPVVDVKEKDVDADYYWTAMQYIVDQDHEKLGDAFAADEETSDESEADSSAEDSSEDTSEEDSSDDTGSAYEKAYYQLDRENAQKLSGVLFGNYNAQQKGLPQIPDVCDFVTYDRTQRMYTFEEKQTEDLKPYITKCEAGDDTSTWNLTVELHESKNDDVLATYNLVMEESMDPNSENNLYKYMFTGCVNEKDAADSEGSDDVEAEATEAKTSKKDTESTEAKKTEQKEEEKTTEQTTGSQSEGEQTTAQPSAGEESKGGITKSKAQSAAKDYMNDHVEDSTNYSLAYAGVKSFDGVEYYNYKVTKKNDSGNSSYVTNIYVDRATGSDVFDESK